MTLSTLLVAGSIELFVRGQQVYRANERAAELQEIARHALALLELDLRMAGYWGLSNRSERIANSATPAMPLPPALVSAASSINACGANWALHLSQHIGAIDNRYTLPCAAYNRRPQNDSDVLIIRRASNPVSAPPATPRLRIIANHGQGSIIIAPCNDFSNSACSRTPPPLPVIPGASVHDLIVNAYYVSRDATGRNGLPSLRRKRLAGGTGGASIQDEEIIAGVENLQIQVGTGSTTDHVPIQFRNPSEVDFNDTLHPVVAVRLWLLIRAETAEVGFVDSGLREFPPGRRISASGDSLRRLLVTTTVFLRNTRS